MMIREHLLKFRSIADIFPPVYRGANLGQERAELSDHILTPPASAVPILGCSEVSPKQEYKF